MPVVDQLVTEFKLKDSFSGPAKGIQTATGSLDRDMAGATQGVGGFSDALRSLGAQPVVGAVVSGLQAAAAAAGVLGAALVAGGVKASQSAASLESARLGLAAYSDSAAQTAQRLEILRQVAKAPGLGFLEAVQGATRLQAAGLSFETSAAALQAFGNAIALVGGGKEQLDGVTMALTQMSAKGKVSAEEINQIAERVPQIRQAMIKAFGTADTEQLAKRGLGSKEFIAGIVTALQSLPKASGGFMNAMENLGDAVFMAFAKVGDALNKAIGPMIDRASAFLEYLATSGVFDKIGKSFGAILSGDLGDSALVKVISYLVASIEQIPNILKTSLMIGRGILDGFVSAYNQIANSWVGKNVFKLTTMGVNPVVKDGIGALGKIGEAIGARALGIEAGFTNATGVEQSKRFKPSAESASSPASPKVAINYLAAIAENTKKSADLQRIALGANVGKYGVTPMELSAMRTGRGDPWSKVIDALKEVFGHEVAQAMVQQRRSGMQSAGFR
jgi:tape measure domain-containing protein